MGMGLTPKTNIIGNHTNSNSSSAYKNNNKNNSCNSNSSESWGMGLLFIFFPEEDDNNNNNIIKRKHNLFSFSNSSSSSSSSTINAILKRSNSSHILSKAQSTISICVLLMFITLLLFTLSTFEPTSKDSISSSKIRSVKQQSKINPTRQLKTFPHALQGMGSLYRRGTRAMNNLIVAHVTESVTKPEFRIFLRLLHRSGITSKSDILFIFSSKTISSLSFDNVIVEENVSFSKLMHGFDYSNDSNDERMNHPTSFNISQFVIPSEKEKESGEPIWGRKIKENGNSNNVTESTRLTRLSYGSLLGFDTDELDPENALSGFLPEPVPMNLRRWACYPMLLGRVRRNFKHVMLLDVKEHYVLGDSLSQLRNCNSESVIVTTLPTRKKNPEKKLVNSGFVLGGARGVRRLANAMLTEIVRVITTSHKKRNSVSESTLFNQLVANEFILKNVNLIVSSESTHELSSLAGLMNSKSSSSSFSISKFPIVRRGNSNLDISYVFKKYLCSSPLDFIAYSDC